MVIQPEELVSDMDKELKHWLKMYLLDILCGLAFWGLVFAVFCLMFSFILR